MLLSFINTVDDVFPPTTSAELVAYLLWTHRGCAESSTFLLLEDTMWLRKSYGLLGRRVVVKKKRSLVRISIASWRNSGKCENNLLLKETYFQKLIDSYFLYDQLSVCSVKLLNVLLKYFIMVDEKNRS